MDDIDDQFGDELYIDGNASGNGKRIHGIESFVRHLRGATNGYVGPAQRHLRRPPTDLGNYGGTGATLGPTSSGPPGTGDAHYDFWSPLIVDYTDTAWFAATKTWPNTCKEALRYGIIKSKKNKSKKGHARPDHAQRRAVPPVPRHSSTASQQINVNRGDEKPAVRARASRTSPTSTGWTSPTSTASRRAWATASTSMQMELMLAPGPAVRPEGPDYDIATQSGGPRSTSSATRFNPRYQTKWAALG
jgi:hypothetical protein